MANPRDTRMPQSTTVAALHVPAVVVLIAVSAGIVADWHLPGTEWGWWIGSAIASAVVWGVLFAGGRTRWSAIPLLIACGLLAAAWHHAQWSLVPPHELLAYATDHPRPVRLRAVVDSVPVLVPATVDPSGFPTALPKFDRTLVDLRVVALIAEGSREIPIPAAGRTRLDVRGVLPAMPRGTSVEVWGLLLRPSPARNPGGFDFRLFLREQGIHTLVRCEFPKCVQVRSPPPTRWLPDVSVWQSIVANRLRSRLSPQTAPLAIALLLGPRSEITPELKEAFLQSGMVHFLAISGINVAILVLFLWLCGRLLCLPRRLQLLLMGLCVAGYVAITDADPPVIRAAVLVWVMLLGLASGRPAAALNHLAVAGLIILIFNPHDLFQVGTQLSFLAILALNWLWSIKWLVTWRPVDALDELSLPWWRRGLGWVAVHAWGAFITTCAVWIFTLPLVLARFHLVSPIGFVLNVLLSFWMTATLFAGYACLACVIFCPPAAVVVAPIFDGGLFGFAWIVRHAADIPWGHFKLVGPPDGWLAVFYVLLLSISSGLLSPGLRRWAWRSILMWCVAGLAWGLPPSSNPGLRCTFLSVGHGVAILIELPNKQTLLYDAGSLEDGVRAQRVVESALLARGLTRIDALVISHADIDHFNAVPGLLENFPVGVVYLSPAFLDFHQSSVRKVCEAALQANVPLRLVWAGDRLKCGDDVSVEILLPPARGLSMDDNANSIVLSVHYAGRGLLLTGDLEKAGMQALLRMPPQAHDILLSPHHGSLKANPPDLARWVVPRWVVVSGGADIAADKLRQNYGAGATLLTTARQGAITVEVTPGGDVSVQTQLGNMLPDH